MQLSKIYKKNRILFHIAFWGSYILFFTFAWAGMEGNYWDSFFYELAQLPVRLSMVYFGLYYLMPQYLLKKKYVLFIVYLIVAFLVVGIAQSFMDKVVYEYFKYGSVTYVPDWDTGYILRCIVRSNSVFAVAAALKILSFWFQKEQEALILQQEKTTAELNFLKFQIQPHFFFNTLNTLYGLTLTSSKKAPELVLKLSDLMRYLLYETRADKVPLKKEIQYLTNYMELEKMRFDNYYNIQFTINGSLDGQLIPPMLLLPFVENAFKHSLCEEENNAFIAIAISIHSDYLTFKVENTINKNEHSLNETGGIGLKNVKKRLDLLFPKTHQLKILAEQGMYLISLRIPLLSNG